MIIGYFNSWVLSSSHLFSLTCPRPVRAKTSMGMNWAVMEMRKALVTTAKLEMKARMLYQAPCDKNKTTITTNKQTKTKITTTTY